MDSRLKKQTYLAFDSVRSPVILLNDQDTIIHLNPAAEKATGYKKEFIDHLPVFSVLALPENSEFSEELSAEAQFGRESSTAVLTFHPASDGSYTLIRWNSVRILNPDRSLRYKVLSGEDITHKRSSTIEEKKFLSLIKSEEMFRTMLDNIQDAVLVLSGQDIIFANQAFERMTGKSLDQLYRSGLESVLEGTFASALLRRYTRFTEDPSARKTESRVTVRSPDGSIQKIIHIRGEFTYLRGKKILVIQARDETKQKLNERELRRTRWQLNDTIERLTVTNRALSDSHIRLEELSSRDQLTGLPNRRVLDEFLEHEWKRSYRTRSPLSVLLIDIDYFKQYNDFYGHVQGDQCLKNTAETLNSVMQRSADLLARYGGEEFVAVLPDTDTEGAIIVGNKLISELSKHNFVHEKSPSGRVSVSIGAATMTPDSLSDPHIIIKRADAGLYRAKEKGRARVEPVREDEIL